MYYKNYIYDMKGTILNFHLTDLVPGFKRVYDKNKNNVIFTDLKYDYVEKVLEKYNLQFNYRTANCNGFKHKMINKYIETYNINRRETIAFVCDEKDAFLFNSLGIDYYIVNRVSGYADFPSNIYKGNITSMRCKFLCHRAFFKNDKYPNVFKGFVSKYMDDLVLYYRRTYYAKGDNDRMPEPFFTINGSKLDSICWENFGIRKAEEPINNKFWHEKYWHDFDIIEIKSNLIMCKVPGSKETKDNYKKNSICSKIIDYLCEKHNIPYSNKGNILYRLVETEPLRYNNEHRSVKDIKATIEVRNRSVVKGKLVYLFDDIFTTGASMIACAEKLYEAGAGHVVCFAIAKTARHKVVRIDGGEA